MFLVTNENMGLCLCMHEVQKKYIYILQPSSCSLPCPDDVVTSVWVVDVILISKVLHLSEKIDMIDNIDNE